MKQFTSCYVNPQNFLLTQMLLFFIPLPLPLFGQKESKLESK